VAVLLDDSDVPILTALTASDGNTLWLKWEKWQTPKDHSLQLWAKSRRDGQIRPLLVFGNRELKEVKLDEATLRLIKDSSHLIITQEEVGGSSLDEPSDMIIAKGICIRLAETRDSA
jgi:anti-sigma-K factor RskA